MGTYCGNHILEEVRKASDQAKGGEVTLKKTNEGSCGHSGGCTTAHDDLFELRYEYQPSKEAKDDAAAEDKEETDAKKEAESSEDTAETTTKEKPAEEPAVTV